MIFVIFVILFCIVFGALILKGTQIPSTNPEMQQIVKSEPSPAESVFTDVGKSYYHDMHDFLISPESYNLLNINVPSINDTYYENRIFFLFQCVCVCVSVGRD